MSLTMMQAKNKFLPFLIAPAVLASFVANPVAAYPTKPTNLVLPYLLCQIISFECLQLQGATKPLKRLLYKVYGSQAALIK